MTRQLTIQDYLIMQVQAEKKLTETNQEIEKLKAKIRILESQNYRLKQRLDSAESALRVIHQAINKTDIVGDFD